MADACAQPVIGMASMNIIVFIFFNKFDVEFIHNLRLRRDE